MTTRSIAIIGYIVFSAAGACSQGNAGQVSLPNGGRQAVQSATSRAGVKQSLPHPYWMVKYDFGSLGLKPGQWLKLAFVSRAALNDLVTPVVSVPADQLVTVEYSAKREKTSHLMRGPRSRCSYAHGLMPDAAKSPRPELAVAIAVSPGPLFVLPRG